MQGRCAPGERLSPRPDAGRPADGGANKDGGAREDGPQSLDGGHGDDDAGASRDASGDPYDGGARDGGDDAGADAGAAPIDAGAPGIVSFAADPASITIGESVTLTWVGHDLASCALEGQQGALTASGSLVLARPAGRPYVLRCLDVHGDEHAAEVSVTLSCDTTTLSSVTITSDADLASYAPYVGTVCVDVTGDVTIENLTTTDLTGLYGLRSVGGDFEIGGNLSLTSLDGLELLEHVGRDLRLGYQEASGDPLMTLPVLTSLHGLSALTTVGVDLQILEADSLTSLAGLERVTEIGDDLQLDENDLLVSLRGLDRLSFIGNDLEIDTCPQLPSLAGLEALTSLGGAIQLSHLPALGDLEPLAGLSGEIQHVYLNDLDALETLAGLEGITSLFGYLQIQYNGSLLNLDGLAQLTRTERVMIRRNNSLVDADLPSLESVRYTGDQTCSGSGFPCDGAIYIEGNPLLTSLPGYASLVDVQRELHIVNNAALNSVTGFSLVPSVANDLVITDNAALTSVTGLASLGSTDDVKLLRNPQLSSLSFPSLSAIADDLEIVDNDSLTTLQGLTALGDVGGDLIIEGNDALLELKLSSLATVGDYDANPPCARGCLFHVRQNASLPLPIAQAFLEETDRPVDNADLTDNVDLSGNNTN